MKPGSGSEFSEDDAGSSESDAFNDIFNGTLGASVVEEDRAGFQRSMAEIAMDILNLNVPMPTVMEESQLEPDAEDFEDLESNSSDADAQTEIETQSSNANGKEATQTVEAGGGVNSPIQSPGTVALSVFEFAFATDPIRIKEVRKRAKVVRCQFVIPEHVRVLIDEKTSTIKYQCQVCFKKFKTKAHCKYHKYCVPGLEGKPHSCYLCSRTFAAKSHLFYHLRNHIGELPFSCPVCSKRFNQQGKVTRHLRSHTGEKNYACEICSVRYSSAQAVKEHVSTVHNMEKVQCEVCGKQYAGKTGLKKHQMIHKDLSKPFACDKCELAFTAKWILNLHKNRHFTGRPFQCPKCPRAFKYKKDLARHGRVHTGVKPYQCCICNYKFARKDNRDRHLVLTHALSKKMAAKIIATTANEDVAVEKDLLAATWKQMMGSSFRPESRQRQKQQQQNPRPVPSSVLCNRNVSSYMPNECPGRAPDEVTDPLPSSTAVVEGFVTFENFTQETEAGNRGQHQDHEDATPNLSTELDGFLTFDDSRDADVEEIQEDHDDEDAHNEVSIYFLNEEQDKEEEVAGIEENQEKDGNEAGYCTIEIDHEDNVSSKDEKENVTASQQEEDDSVFEVEEDLPEPESFEIDGNGDRDLSEPSLGQDPDKNEEIAVAVNEDSEDNEELEVEEDKGNDAAILDMGEKNDIFAVGLESAVEVEAEGNLGSNEDEECEVVKGVEEDPEGHKAEEITDHQHQIESNKNEESRINSNEDSITRALMDLIAAVKEKKGRESSFKELVQSAIKNVEEECPEDVDVINTLLSAFVEASGSGVGVAVHVDVEQSAQRSESERAVISEIVNAMLEEICQQECEAEEIMEDNDHPMDALEQAEIPAIGDTETTATTETDKILDKVDDDKEAERLLNDRAEERVTLTGTYENISDDEMEIEEPCVETNKDENEEPAGSCGSSNACPTLLFHILTSAPPPSSVSGMECSETLSLTETNMHAAVANEIQVQPGLEKGKCASTSCDVDVEPEPEIECILIESESESESSSEDSQSESESECQDQIEVIQLDDDEEVEQDEMDMVIVEYDDENETNSSSSSSSSASPSPSADQPVWTLEEEETLQLGAEETVITYQDNQYYEDLLHELENARKEAVEPENEDEENQTESNGNTKAKAPTRGVAFATCQVETIFNRVVDENGNSHLLQLSDLDAFVSAGGRTIRLISAGPANDTSIMEDGSQTLEIVMEEEEFGRRKIRAHVSAEGLIRVSFMDQNKNEKEKNFLLNDPSLSLPTRRISDSEEYQDLPVITVVRKPNLPVNSESFQDRDASRFLEKLSRLKLRKAVPEEEKSKTRNARSSTSSSAEADVMDDDDVFKKASDEEARLQERFRQELQSRIRFYSQ